MNPFQHIFVTEGTSSVISIWCAECYRCGGVQQCRGPSAHGHSRNLVLRTEQETPTTATALRSCIILGTASSKTSNLILNPRLLFPYLRFTRPSWSSHRSLAKNTSSSSSSCCLETKLPLHLILYSVALTHLFLLPQSLLLPSFMLLFKSPFLTSSCSSFLSTPPRPAPCTTRPPITHFTPT